LRPECGSRQGSLRCWWMGPGKYATGLITLWIAFGPQAALGLGMGWGTLGGTDHCHPTRRLPTGWCFLTCPHTIEDGSGVHRIPAAVGLDAITDERRQHVEPRGGSGIVRVNRPVDRWHVPVCAAKLAADAPHSIRKADRSNMGTLLKSSAARSSIVRFYLLNGFLEK